MIQISMRGSIKRNDFCSVKKVFLLNIFHDVTAV